MKKYKFSIFFVLLLTVVSYFHFPLQTTLMKMSSGNFLYYVVYGLFFSFFAILFVKSLTSGRNLEIAIVLLLAGLVFFFLLSRPMFWFKLAIMEFFILGILAALENKKTRSVIPFLLLLAAACLVEVVTNFRAGSRFYYMDVWIDSLAGLAGYIAGFLLL